MTSEKQNRRRSPAAHVDSVRVEKTDFQKSHCASKDIHFLPLPSIYGVHAELFIYPILMRPLPRRLSTDEIIENACSPNLADNPGAGAVLFAKILLSGWTLIYWPDGVAILINPAEISAPIGVMLYTQARSALEAYLANSQKRVKL